MRVRSVEWPEAGRLNLSWNPTGPSGHRLDPGAALACGRYLEGQGFFVPDIMLLQAFAPWRGLEENGRVYVSAHDSSPAFLHNTITHEVGHTIEKRVFFCNLAAYFAIRGVIPVRTQIDWDARDNDVFCEDFVLMFGSGLAKSIPHAYRSVPGVTDLGYSLGLGEQTVYSWPERREQLRQLILDKVRASGLRPDTPGPDPPAPQPDPPQEVPEPEKAGASVFADITGHWAEADILECAKAGILRGDPDGRFRPDDNVTRAELATVAARLLRQR